MAKTFEAWERETKNTVSQLQRRRAALEPQLVGTGINPTKFLSVKDVQFTYTTGQFVPPSRLLTEKYLMFFVPKTATALFRFGASAIMSVLVPGLSYGIINDDNPDVWFQAPGYGIQASGSVPQGPYGTVSQSAMYVHSLPSGRYRVYLYATAYPEIGNAPQTLIQTFHSANLSVEFI